MRTAVLKKCLALHSKIVPKKAQLPILEMILIGKGKIVSTDLENCLVSDIPELNEMEEVCVDFNLFKNIINNVITDSLEIKVAKDGEVTKLTICYGDAEFNLISLSAEEFPQLPQENELWKWQYIDTLSTFSIKKVVDSIPYVGKDEHRPVMMHVYIRDKIVGTNGMKMCFYDRPEMDEHFNILPWMVTPKIISLWPKKEFVHVDITASTKEDINEDSIKSVIATHLAKPYDYQKVFIDDEESSTMSITDEAFAKLSQKGYMLAKVRLVETPYIRIRWKEHQAFYRYPVDVYPRYEAVIPQPNIILEVPHEGIILAILNSIAVTGNQVNKMRMKIKPDKIMISAEDTDLINQFSYTLNCFKIKWDCNCQEFETAVSANIFKTLVGKNVERVKMGFSIIDDNPLNNRAIIVNNDQLMMPIAEWSGLSDEKDKEEEKTEESEQMTDTPLAEQLDENNPDDPFIT